jgi:hypothetical protein
MLINHPRRAFRSNRKLAGAHVEGPLSVQVHLTVGRTRREHPVQIVGEARGHVNREITLGLAYSGHGELELSSRSMGYLGHFFRS